MGWLYSGAVRQIGSDRVSVSSRHGLVAIVALGWEVQGFGEYVAGSPGHTSSPGAGLAPPCSVSQCKYDLCCYKIYHYGRC